LLKLELQLDTYIDVMRKDDRFCDLENLFDLSVKLVEINRHKVYDLVYLLIKMVLLLLVAMASVERAFSRMDFVKPSGEVRRVMVSWMIALSRSLRDILEDWMKMM